MASLETLGFQNSHKRHPLPRWRHQRIPKKLRTANRVLSKPPSFLEHLFRAVSEKTPSRQLMNRGIGSPFGASLLRMHWSTCNGIIRLGQRDRGLSSMQPIRDLFDWFKGLSLAYKVTFVLVILVALIVLGGE